MVICYISFMNLLGPKKSYLGADLGSSAIKMVELNEKNGRAQLASYGYVEQPTDIVRASSDEMEHKIVEILKEVHHKSRMSSKRVIAALPSFSVFSSIISLPLMNKKDLGQAIRWEAKKFVPLPIEEMTLDWKIVPEISPERLDKFSAQKMSAKPGQGSSAEAKSKAASGEGAADNSGDQAEPALAESAGQPKAGASIFNKFSTAGFFGKKEETDGGQNKKVLFNKKTARQNIKILLTAAPKKLVERYIRIFKEAGLELISLETESFALERSLVGGDPAPVMIIDIGAISSDVAIIENNIPILTRSIDVGGTAFTKAVMNSLNVDINRAEQFKRDIGFSASGPGDLPDIIKQAINPIVNEVKYSLDIFQSQHTSGRTIEKIILTGGSAFLPELVSYLSKLLDIKIIIGDPWDRVVYPLELKAVLTELGPRFAVAVGLAMREI